MVGDCVLVCVIMILVHCLLSLLLVAVVVAFDVAVLTSYFCGGGCCYHFLLFCLPLLQMVVVFIHDVVRLLPLLLRLFE